ncbi:MAG: hypothetical protein ABW032_11330 [Burkholderiaceae bacterium]
MAALLLAALAAGAAHAQEDAFAAVEPEALDSAVVDQAVFATLLPNPKPVTRAIVDSAVATVLMHPLDPSRRPVVPGAEPRPVATAPRPIRVDASASASSPSMFRVIDGQYVQVHADGLPDPNAPSSDPFVRVMPRAVNPADVKVGARWGTQDRIPAPLLSQIAWNAQADLFAGPTPAGAESVRRSLRITAQWDRPDDLKIGFTPGLQRGGGTLFEHYVTTLQASTVDQTRAAHWRSFIELSGEKLGPGKVIDNPTAQVHAGATYSTSSSTQLDVSVTRGTTAVSDLQSSLGLQVHF